MRDEPGRVEGGRHGLVAGAFARRHHGRPGRGGPGGGRVGVRHRGRSGPVGAAAALADRRRPGRGDRCSFEAGGGDRRRMRNAGATTPTRARAVAARTTRPAKEHGVEGELVARWRGELASIGWPVERLGAAIDGAARRGRAAPEVDAEERAPDARRGALGSDGELARRKVFCPPPCARGTGPAPVRPGPPSCSICSSVGPSQDPEVIPLVGVAGAREQPHALASVLATRAGHRQRHRPASWSAATPPSPPLPRWSRPSPSAETDHRRRPVRRAAPGRREHLRARGGAPSSSWAWPAPARPPCCRVVAAAFEAAGCRVVGTATSGQAARTLGREAELGESRTLASLLWRLDHDRLRLDERSRGHPRRSGHDRGRPPGRASPPASRPPGPSWCSSATTISWVRSALAGRSPPWSDATPTSSTT